MYSSSASRKPPRHTAPLSFLPLTLFLLISLALLPHPVLSSSTPQTLHHAPSSRDSIQSTQFNAQPFPDKSSLFSNNEQSRYLGRDLRSLVEAAENEWISRELADDLGCVAPGAFDSNTDYFASTRPASVTLGASLTTPEFSIEFHRSYKLLSSVHTPSIYALYLCGTPLPAADDLPDGSIPVQIPLDTYGFTTQTLFPLLQLLQVEGRLAFYPSSAALPECAGLDVPGGLVQRPCDFDEECAETAWKNEASGVETVFVDSFTTLNPPENTEDEQYATVVVPQELASTVEDTASYLMYLAAFFNKERSAETILQGFTEQFACLDARGMFDEGDSEARLLTAIRRKQAVNMVQNDRAVDKETIAAIENPYARRAIMEDNAFKQKVMQRVAATIRVAQQEPQKNVLILTAYQQPGLYYVGDCPNYYCEFAEASDDNVRVIDADFLGLDPNLFFLANQSALVQQFAQKGVTIDVVIFQGFLDNKNPQEAFPGPEQNGDHFFTKFIDDVQALNPAGKTTRAFYIPDTDLWFNYRPGVPQFAFADYIKMINPENPENGDGFYFFDNFPVDANTTVLATAFGSNCGQFGDSATVCVVQGGQPSVPPTLAPNTVPTKAPTSGAAGNTVALMTLAFATTVVLCLM